jgi:hypothetical protein
MQEMRTILQKYVYTIALISFLFAFPANIYAQFLDTVSVSTLTATESSGEKPQSKVWRHDANWWSVIPDSAGTHIYRLVGNAWVKGAQLSTFTNYQADTKNMGDVTYILLLYGALILTVIIGCGLLMKLQIKFRYNGVILRLMIGQILLLNSVQLW